MTTLAETRSPDVAMIDDIGKGCGCFLLAAAVVIAAAYAIITVLWGEFV